MEIIYTDTRTSSFVNKKPSGITETQVEFFPEDGSVGVKQTSWEDGKEYVHYVFFEKDQWATILKRSNIMC